VRLKRLELSGFKTFPERTALQFAAQITGIVGPNGSGTVSYTHLTLPTICSV